MRAARIAALLAEAYKAGGYVAKVGQGLSSPGDATVEIDGAVAVYVERDGHVDIRAEKGPGGGLVVPGHGSLAKRAA